MIVGVIKTKDLVLHPFGVISVYGLKGFLRLLKCAFSRRKYQFIDFLELTGRTLIGKRK